MEDQNLMNLEVIEMLMIFCNILYNLYYKAYMVFMLPINWVYSMHIAQAIYVLQSLFNVIVFMVAIVTFSESYLKKYSSVSALCDTPRSALRTTQGRIICAVQYT